ncbi:ankyrin repeat and sterile alpha motif domain-containing protein 1B-like [Salvelinus namaycush]|uniref:Ankyrin repeat and sterile alpha motif domain-containing protein 1B-like n=1 Tax=Salvelinus namaycush TaxID=8040 RepID=A0A8U0PZT9_SALNM|nr:ankyrin repeat and sterile alpha motif domain-containing protein 1B-like [Salvelinus namaycush]
MDTASFLCIDANITDCQGRTALEILREHPAQKSQQITALMQEYMMEEMMDNKCVLMEEPIRQCPVPTPRTSIPSLSASPSLRHKNDAVTGELSKLLNEMKMCRDRDYSFEELCQTISSHSHSMESFGSGHLSDEERRSNGTLSRVRKRPTPPLPPAQEEEEGEKSCGPAGFWEALTPCNGCHNLGFSSLSQDSKRSAEIVPSPSLDVFLPEDEDNPYESVTTAVTRKPCSLDIGLFNTCPLNGHSPQVTVTEPELCNHRNSSSPTGPTPDCSPPSPDTALKSIDRVIRPQPKQRTSLSSSLDVQNQRPVNHSCDPSEVSSSLGYASISTSPPASPPVSPNQDSPGSNDDCPLTDDGPYQQNPPPASSNTLPLPDDRRQSLVPVEFAGLLHGSSPACETPDTPYHLYTSNTNPKARKHTPSDPHTSPVTTLGNHGNLASVTQPFELGIGLPPPLIIPHTGNEALALKSPKDPLKDDRPPKPQVVYRTIFHTRVNQNPQSASPSSSSSPYGWNGEAVVVRGGVSGAGGPREGTPATGYEDRAFTLGRMRSIPRSVLDLKLSKSLSKSDSNLVAVSPIQV